MLIKRREFLQSGALATASFMLPKFLKAFEKKGFGNLAQGNKVVVVLQLSGGNDGLNTVIPVRNDIYYKLRPRLGLEQQKTLSITDEVSLHPSLTAFKKLHDEGSLGILNNVGYPNPDRSHFRSMDIWQTASASNQYLQSGWIGRYLDAQCSGCDKATQAIEIDDLLSFALKGEKQNGIACKNPAMLYNDSHSSYYKALVKNHAPHDEHHEQPVDYLYKTMAETLSSADYIYQQSKTYNASTAYPKTELGKNLQTIASLILSNINTRIYYVSLGSFDTHVNQQQQQQHLFTEMNDAVEAFTNDLKTNHRFDDVLLFTFSEFGRRVAQNASGGTDHGTANNMFLISGALKQKGLINAMPSLTNLQDGDLTYQVDFKNVYATVLKKWLDTDDAQILGSRFDYLNFI